MTKDLIKKIILGAEIQKSDVVLIQFWGEDSDLEVLHNFSEEVAAVGASPIEFQQSRRNNAALFSNVSESCFNDKYFEIFKPVDVVIDVFMYEPVVPSEDFPKEKFDFYRKYMRNLFTAFEDKKKLIQIRIPTVENSIGTGLEPEVFINLMNEAYNIDYKELKTACENKVAEIKDKNEIVIETEFNNKLTLSTKDRKWFIDAGDGDLPCGEIYIAPVETETNGSIYFKELYLEGDEKPVHLTDVTMKVVNGKVTETSSDIINDYLKNLPEDGDIVGEFAIGFNPNVKSLTGYTCLDEKMKGTFHIGLGMNTLFGGNINSMAHTDFVNTGKVSFK